MNIGQPALPANSATWQLPNCQNQCPDLAGLGKQQLSNVLIIECHEKPSITQMNGILNTRPGEKTSVRCSSVGDKIIYYVSILYRIIMMCNA